MVLRIGAADQQLVSDHIPGNPVNFEGMLRRQWLARRRALTMPFKTFMKIPQVPDETTLSPKLQIFLEFSSFWKKSGKFWSQSRLL